MKRNNKDLAYKKYWENKGRMVELLNRVLFDGENVVRSDGISSTERELSAEVGKASNKRSFTRLLDGAKLVSIGGMPIYVYLENQTYIDYAMTERNITLEAACYHEQRAKLRKEHENAKDLKDDGEFLSGMRKEERFIPALCIVLYYGDTQWDAACSLHEILRFPDICPQLRQIVNDDHVLVLDVKRLEGVDTLQTDLRETFMFIKYASDKDKLWAYINENQELFQNMQEDALEFIAYTTETTRLLKIKDEIRTEKGGYDVCKAISDMRQESREEGICEGIKIGEKRGERRGEKRGERRGRQKQEEDMYRSLISKKLQKGKSLEQIADDLEKEVSEIQIWIQRLQII